VGSRPDGLLTVGALARRTGLTPKAVRHYDRIGLLRPAEVDASGNPIDWPGWTLLADGTWVLDPSAPFYDLRAEAVVEIRINPSNDAVAVYPPPTPNCNAAPPSTTPPTVVPASSSSSALPATGVEAGGFLAAAMALLIAGVVGTAFAARSRRRVTE